VVDDDDGLRVVLGAHEEVRRRRLVALALDAFDADGRRARRDGLGRDRDDRGFLQGVPGDDGSAVARAAGAAEPDVVAPDDLDGHLGRGDDGRPDAVAGDLVVEERGEASHGREAPLFLTP